MVFVSIPPILIASTLLLLIPCADRELDAASYVWIQSLEFT